MSTLLRVLMVEDRATDAELLERQLSRAGFEAHCTRVETEDAFRRELARDYDVILCDYELPQFTGPRALEILKESGRLIPFILVSGTLGEEKAVAIIKDGAADYLLKDRLARLGQAVAQAIEQYRLRRERQEFLEALGKAEARYRGIFENALEGIFRADAEYRGLAANPAMASIFGYPSAAALLDEVPLLPVGLFADQARAREFIGRLAADGVVAWFETEALRRDGSRILVLLRVLRLAADDGTTFYDGILVDITERRRVEEELSASQAQLHQSQKMEAVGLLAGGIAHDFNNLLTVINGTAELALLDKPADSTSADAFREIQRAGQRAAALTSQLLAFSRKQLVQCRIVQPNDVVRGIASMLSRMLGESIEVSTMLHPELGTVLGDPNQLEQIIVNLAVNARDAMPRGGTITVRTSNVTLDEEQAARVGVASGTYVTLAVSDTGLGMDDDTKSRVFEPFYTTKEPGKGTGLGLSTVYGIARQAMGWVTVDSVKGEGATFTVGMPVATAAESPSRAEPFRPAVRGTGRILLVEDDEAVRAVTSRMLQSGGYRVTEAVSAAEAITLVEGGQPFDLVLSDVVMPLMGGIEMVEGMKASQPGLRVLFCSGYAQDALMPETAERALYVIQKPFTSSDLLQMVRDALGTANPD